MTDLKALRFAPQFVPKILAGEKGQTFRLSSPIYPGDTVEMTADGTAFATAFIVRVEDCAIRTYNTWDHGLEVSSAGLRQHPVAFAKASGFDTPGDLASFLDACYPHSTGDYRGVLIVWGDVKPLQQPAEDPK
jgi:hypothetical protein